MTAEQVSSEQVSGSTVRRLIYSASSVDERILAKDELQGLARPEIDERGAIVWLDVIGTGDDDVLATIADRLGLHSLAMEDVVHEGQRPKVDLFEDHAFIVMSLPHSSDGKPRQVSIFLARGLVVTLHNERPTVFDGIVKRIQGTGGRIRRGTSDYLAYAILDSIIDDYLPIVEALQERVEDIGEDVLASRGDESITELFEVRREFVTLRRDVVWMRDVFSILRRDDGDLFAESTMPFLSDCADHVAMNLEAIESGRDLIDTLIEVHATLVGQGMNEIMKVLTIIATIFIPLSFVAGVFGMNFEHMPELRHPYAYPIALGAMALIAGGMLLYFRRLGWIGGRSRET